MKIREIFSKNLKKARKIKGFKSSRMLAEKIDVAPITLALIESGSRMPSEDTLAKIAAGLDCEETDLFKDPNDKPKINPDDLIASLKAAIHLIDKIPPKYIELLQKIDWTKPGVEKVIASLIKSAGIPEENSAKKKA